MKNDQNKPKPGETIQTTYLDTANKWCYRVILRAADSGFKYGIVLERANGRGWETIGNGYADTKIGAAWWARKTKRKHERRFGGN